jgi:hypothetical protein
MTAMLSAPRVMHASCGPLEILLAAEDERLAAVALNHLDLFAPAWTVRTRAVNVQLVRENSALQADGSYLRCGQMVAGRNGAHYAARTSSGLVAQGHCGARSDVWVVSVPDDVELDEVEVGALEDLFSLICTVGWRQEGWIPVHAAAVAKNGACAILCAPSGGGKSTLTAALARNGWQTLGDDKLLLRRVERDVRLRSLLQTFNLDPQTRRWFDVGDIDRLPRYSAFTNKRRVFIGTISSLSPMISSATPTHVVRVIRDRNVSGVCATPMRADEVLPALLRQIVIPADPSAARWIVGETAACAAKLRGLELRVGDDAYGTPEWLSAVEEAILCK